MKTKIQIKSVFGNILFEYEKENNTIKDTLEEAIKGSANLSYANLSYTDLSYANLSIANLSSADLRSADLSYANLSSAENSEYAIAVTRILPGGDIIGWKKCQGGVIVKLLIPSDAKRSSAFSRKCRAEYVKVLEVIGEKEGISSHDGKTKYTKDKTVKCDKWDDNFQNECSGGIHFFITKIEAEKY